MFKKIFFLWLVVFAFKAQAQVSAIRLKNTPVFEPTRWPFDSQVPPFKDRNLQRLRELKEAELKKDFKHCSELAQKIMNPDIDPWLVLSEMKCALGDGQEVSTQQAALEKALIKMQKKINLLSYGPWAKDLFQTYVKGLLWMVSVKSKSHRNQAWPWLEKLLVFEAQMSSEDRAKALQLASDLAFLEQKISAADFLIRQSLSFSESLEARNRYRTLQTAQNLKVEGEDSSGNLVKEKEGEEQILQDKVRSEIKQNRLLLAVEDALVLLKKSPNHKKSSWAADKIIEIYSGVLSQKKPEFKEVSDRMLALMKQAPVMRRVDWVAQAQRNLDYDLVVQLASASLKELQGNPQASTLLWSQARASHHLGDYSQALNLYQKFIEQNNGVPESQEALFRIGVIYFRKGNHSAAAQSFEKYLLGTDPSKFELSARYWMIRSLEKMKSSRLVTEKEIVQKKFPYSYYGLRLKAEDNQGVLVIDPTREFTNMESEYWLTQAQMKGWKRFLLLAQAGWFEEAQKENVFLPSPLTAVAKVVFAQQLKAAFQHASAIKLVNEAIDLDENLRGLDILQIGFPVEFTNTIEEVSRKNKVNGVLIRSLIRQESAYRMNAVSSSNAAGLMQLISPTAREVLGELGIKNVKLPDDLFKPDLNLTIGTYYFAKVLKQFGGCVPLALAAYNAGPYKVQKWLDARPDLNQLKTEPSSAPEVEIWMDEVPWSETNFYMKAILRNALLYQVLEKGRVELPSVLWKNLGFVTSP